MLLREEGQRRRLPAALDPGPVVIQSEERDDRRDIRLVAHVVADPSGVGKDVMRLGPARRNELLADEQRERQVRKPIAVHVPQLAASELELDAAEPVRPGRY